jgi:ABC-type multidrug transport system fused ATPase/permease subunit
LHSNDHAWLDALGWDDWFAHRFALLGATETLPARVVADHGTGRLVSTGEASMPADLDGRLAAIARRRSDPELPAVGDWVAISRSGGRAVIHHVLERRTAFRRKVAGHTSQEQVLAANVDVAIVVAALDADVNLRRLERTLAMALSSGARPVVVLSKADLATPEVARRLAAEVERVAAGAPVVALSAITGGGVERLPVLLPDGRTGVLLGPSGAGKSTLVQLLLRLRPPSEGSYLIDGTPAASIAQSDWYRLVSYVPQEPRLLHAPVAENIRFFRDLSDEQVERAARLARIHEDILSWPGGYQAIVGPRADAVSGGQQQRICLARALAAEPEVLVLDEPTSALDPQSEALIGASLKALHRDLTLFIVAHRMSTLESCDRVMVIVDGRVEAFDTRTVLQRDNLYFRYASELAAAGHAV